MKVVAAISIAAAVLVLSALAQSRLGLSLAVIIVIACGVVILLKAPPTKALIIGAVAAYVAIILVAGPIILAIALSGGFESGDNCDGFCVSNSRGAVLAVVFQLIAAVPVAAASGVVSALLSLALRSMDTS